MSGILRRASATVTPAAQLGVACYFQCLVGAAVAGQSVLAEAQKRLVAALTRAVPRSTTEALAGASHPVMETLSHAPTTTTTTRAVSGGPPLAGCAMGPVAAAAERRRPAVDARQTIAPVCRPVTADRAAAPLEGVGRAMAAPATVSTALTAGPSSPTPPPASAAPNGASPAPNANAGPCADPPEGAYAIGRPEPGDRFVRIAGSARSGPATLCYQAFGDRRHPPLVLLAGLGHSSLYWRDDFCAACAEAGFYVVRLDNRDAGLSTHVEAWSPPPMWHALMPSWLSPSGDVTPPYLLAHLAEDVRQALDALGLTHAHVVGSSMGGMIAQEMALQAPERLLSLTLFFTSAGGRPVKQPPLRSRLGFLVRPKGDDVASLIDFKVLLDARQMGCFPFDEAASRAYWTRSLQRSPNDIAAFQRQLWALLKSPGRAARLKEVSMSTRSFPPTTIIHGTADVTIPHENGERLAASIHGSKLILWPDMGHAIPEELDSRFVAQLATQLKP